MVGVVRKQLPSIIAVAVVALLVWLFAREQREKGALAERVKTLTAEREQLAQRAAVARVVFVRDTIRLTRTVTRWETVRDSVLRIDTLTRTDTVVRTLIAAADTTIKACRETVRSCTESLRLADSIHVVDQRLIAAYRKRPSLLTRARNAAVLIGTGYLAGRLTR